MKIDERIEQHVRDAFAAAAGEERDRFDAALNSLSDQNGPKAWTYAAYVVGYIINDIEATDQDLDGIAQRAIDATSSWINLGDKAAVKALMRAASQGDPNIPGVPPEKVVDMTFVLGSYLLQAYRPDDQEWWDYLSDVWAQAEAAPEPS